MVVPCSPLTFFKCPINSLTFFRFNVMLVGDFCLCCFYVKILISLQIDCEVQDASRMVWNAIVDKNHILAIYVTGPAKIGHVG